MGQFTIESISTESAFDMSEYGLQLDDDINIATLQSQGGYYALYAKKFILIDIVEPLSAAGIVSADIKQRIQFGIITGAFSKNRVMKYLIDVSEIEILASHIAMLTAHSILKDVDNINEIPNEIMNMYLMPDSVAIPMGYYVAIVCIGNNHYNANSFNEIFANAWHNYFETALAKLLMLRMTGNTWKKQFSGCLFDY